MTFIHDDPQFADLLRVVAANRGLGVSLVEKDYWVTHALQRRVPAEASEPAVFVRHFEDSARIIEAEADLPALGDHPDVRSLADDTLAKRQIRALPRSTDPAFALAKGARTDAIRRASDAITPMFWGPRMMLDSACAAIRAWISRRLEVRSIGP
jgi:hypothetical protein